MTRVNFKGPFLAVRFAAAQYPFSQIKTSFGWALGLLPRMVPSGISFLKLVFSVVNFTESYKIGSIVRVGVKVTGAMLILTHSGRSSHFSPTS